MLLKREDDTAKLVAPIPEKYKRIYVDHAAALQEQTDALADANRDTRNQLLTESDWTQMADSPLTDEAKALWVTYRTALRDIPAHEDWPELVDADWPTKL